MTIRYLLSSFGRVVGTRRIVESPLAGSLRKAKAENEKADPVIFSELSQELQSSVKDQGVLQFSLGS